LIYSYGTEYVNVLKYLPAERWSTSLQEEQRAVLSAQIHHAVFKEMALKLVDVVFRRTDLTSAAKPDSEMLRFCADTMGKVLDWEDHRIEQELEEVNLRFAWNH
jgi:glycerol-3-phosphate dehydrogenase